MEVVRMSSSYFFWGDQGVNMVQIAIYVILTLKIL